MYLRWSSDMLIVWKPCLKLQPGGMTLLVRSGAGQGAALSAHTWVRMRLSRAPGVNDPRALMNDHWALMNDPWALMNDPRPGRTNWGARGSGPFPRLGGGRPLPAATREPPGRDTGTGNGTGSRDLPCPERGWQPGIPEVWSKGLWHTWESSRRLPVYFGSGPQKLETSRNLGLGLNT